MKRGVVLLSLLLLATACEKTGYSRFSTKYNVYFNCDITVYPYNGVTTYGRFLTVRKSEGMLIIVDSDGKDFKQPLSNDDNRRFILGLSGLIIGTPTFNNDGISVWAYDLGCPECDAPNVRLKIDRLDRTASCSKCKGKWNLDADGTPINDDGKELRPLYRYPTTQHGSILTISN
jgi:hypothetical protein